MCLSVAIVLGSYGGALYAQVTVEIEVHETPSVNDDYICWSPAQARARIESSQQDDLKVKIKSLNSGQGRVKFSSQASRPITTLNYAPTDDIDLVLPADGSWVNFVVSGSRASIDGKDVAIQALDAESHVELGRVAVMVRVRKNADKLSHVEMDRLLSALATLNDHRGAIPSQNYEKYATAHGLAFNIGIHNAQIGWPLFLAWHRAFLLSLERELQSIDPRVTIPYWRFDENNTNIFTERFMGTVSSPSSVAQNIVRFSSTNPLLGWRMSSGGALIRRNDSTTRLQDIYPESGFQILNSIMQGEGSDSYGGQVPSRGINSQLERRHHNFAHVSVMGWLGSGTSPRDPLFFLLHANVDRAWAEWQAKLSRFRDSDLAAYPLQGTYPGPADPNRRRKGSYADDVMWPWSQDNGDATSNDDADDWPSAGFAFLSSPAGLAPTGAPTPGSMIDYLGLLDSSNSIGVCYDNIDYFGTVQ